LLEELGVFGVAHVGQVGVQPPAPVPLGHGNLMRSRPAAGSQGLWTIDGRDRWLLRARSPAPARLRKRARSPRPVPPERCPALPWPPSGAEQPAVREQCRRRRPAAPPSRPGGTTRALSPSRARAPSP